MPPYKRLFFVLAIITLSTTLFVLLFRRIDNDNFENVRDSSHNLYDLSNYMDNNRKIKEVPGPQKTGDSSESGKVDDLVMGINGESLMGKMVNETLRAQLGKSTWYFLHVMASRYPQDPTTTEQKRTQSFLQLLAYLYPCGDW
ncbi:FAD-linked sulfhydryl oxidase ERV2 [Zancudomyces culisetae]|uniref:Sulfhydryl oxidase n=1 Tax=Zancudomyces culisetae TaxID=1213189 RepID=A0A1R1PXD6_ZANCU|nr:FAD-linked sulfhydryl oxidase ERV2 [Zancudomyces culisetae]|eukprot:OMH85646.1 FAD-linked sulfhydryl oxidase ERV2 [Zancudomyces culisetae]